MGKGAGGGGGYVVGRETGEASCRNFLPTDHVG